MPDGEMTMARAALRVGAALVVPVVAALALWRGPAGALTGLGGVALVVGNFAAGAWLVHRAARYGPAAVMAATLGGYVGRIVLLALLLVVLLPLDVVDGVALAASVVPTLVILLAYEVRVVSRHSELWWLVDGKDRL